MAARRYTLTVESSAESGAQLDGIAERAMPAILHALVGYADADDCGFVILSDAAGDHDVIYRGAF